MGLELRGRKDREWPDKETGTELWRALNARTGTYLKGQETGKSGSGTLIRFVLFLKKSFSRS